MIKNGTVRSRLKKISLLTVLLLLFTSKWTFDLFEAKNLVEAESACLEGALTFNDKSSHGKVERRSPKSDVVAVKYTPSALENHVTTNARKHNMSSTSGEHLRPMCNLIQPSLLDDYLRRLHSYNSLLENASPLEDDIRQLIMTNGYSICDELPSLETQNSSESLFTPNQLSHSSSAGSLEPLLPPMRHPQFCNDKSLVMDLTFLVHDFPKMCKNLRPSSRTIFVDVGADLDFHGSNFAPAMHILNLYKKFGFYFDHVYAYEITAKEPSRVFKNVPTDFFAAFHWINVGAGSDPQDKLNPLKMLADNFNKNDFIVFKLDIDTPSIENPLAHQLLHDEALEGLIDHFYFEHHVYLKELSRPWGGTMGGSVADTLELFQSLRKRGIGAHSWI